MKESLGWETKWRSEIDYQHLKYITEQPTINQLSPDEHMSMHFYDCN